MSSLNTHHLKLKYYFNMQKGKLVKGYTLVNGFLTIPATLLKNPSFKYNRNFTDFVLHLNRRIRYSTQELIIPYLVNFKTQFGTKKTAAHCHTLSCCQF